MGLKWSHHKNRGWRSQLDRVRRWYRRVQRIGRANATIDDLEEVTRIAAVPALLCVFAHCLLLVYPGSVL